MNTPDLTGLEAFTREWGLDTAAKRLAKRAGSSIEEIRAFHEAIVPRLQELIDFLNTFPVEEIPAEYRALGFTVLAALETDDPLHIWRRPNLKRASDMRSWYTKTSLYDRNL
jgi:hypothetical protein